METAIWFAIILRSLRDRDINNMKQAEVIELIVDKLQHAPKNVSIPDLLHHIQTRMKIEKMTPIFDGSYKMDDHIEPQNQDALYFDREVRVDSCEMLLYLILFALIVISFVLALL